MILQQLIVKKKYKHYMRRLTKYYAKYLNKDMGLTGTVKLAHIQMKTGLVMTEG